MVFVFDLKELDMLLSRMMGESDDALVFVLELGDMVVVVPAAIQMIEYWGL
jgi:hypothetical protein